MHRVLQHAYILLQRLYFPPEPRQRDQTVCKGCYPWQIHKSRRIEKSISHTAPSVLNLMFFSRPARDQILNKLKT